MMPGGVNSVVTEPSGWPISGVMLPTSGPPVTDTTSVSPSASVHDRPTGTGVPFCTAVRCWSEHGRRARRERAGARADGGDRREQQADDKEPEPPNWTGHVVQR